MNADNWFEEDPLGGSKDEAAMSDEDIPLPKKKRLTKKADLSSDEESDITSPALTSSIHQHIDQFRFVPPPPAVTNSTATRASSRQQQQEQIPVAARNTRRRGGPSPPPPLSLGSTTSRSTRNRVTSYKEDSDENEEEEEAIAPRQTRGRLTKRGATGGGGGTASKRKVESDDEVINAKDVESSEEEEEENSEGEMKWAPSARKTRAAQPQRSTSNASNRGARGGSRAPAKTTATNKSTTSARSQRAASRQKPKYADDTEEEEEEESASSATSDEESDQQEEIVEESEEEEESSEDEAVSGSRPRRAAAKKATKKSKILSDDELESEPEQPEEAEDEEMQAPEETTRWPRVKRGARKKNLKPKPKGKGPAINENTVEKILGHKVTKKGHDLFLIKQKDTAYIHCKWVPADFISSEPHGRPKLARYLASTGILLNTEPLATTSTTTDQTDDPEDLKLNDDDEEPYFNPEFCEIDRIVDQRPGDDGSTEYLVKWRGMQYEDATWETEAEVKSRDPDGKVGTFQRVNLPPSGDVEPIRPEPADFKPLAESPKFKNDNLLREYQLEGLNWLTHCYCEHRNSILADEMGLGKTVQSVSILHHIYSKFRNRGPFIVIAPLSTIGHWQREFERWTDMNCIVYHGSSASREMIRNYEFFFYDKKGFQICEEYKFNVLLTTYEMVLSEASVLGGIHWEYMIVDEAHRLKNKEAKFFEVLVKFSTSHTLLLTGTPLQNGMNELFTIMSFVDPDTFGSQDEFMYKYGDLKDSKQVEELHRLLAPYLLRRMKEDVEKAIPPKEETVVEVEPTSVQKTYYRAILDRNREYLSKGTKTQNMPSLMNVMMEIRKCCCHPYLVSGAEERIARGLTDHESINQQLISACGKMVVVDKLLQKLRAQGGHKVLIFSQLRMMLDILEDYLRYRAFPYERLDGHVRGSERQEAIDRFSNPSVDRFVFLLSTRAGGVGINLTAADTVIIYDSDWNPQNDLQAQARCHRIGQKSEVKVYRLITRNTYEKYMFERASMKMGLDKAVLTNLRSNVQKTRAEQDGDNAALAALERMYGPTGGGEEGKEGKERGTKNYGLEKDEIDKLLRYGAYHLFNEDEAAAKEADQLLMEEDFDKIMERSTVVRYEGARSEGGGAASGAGNFSKATFVSSAADSGVDINDVHFWEKVLPEFVSSEKMLAKLTSGDCFATEETKRKYLEDLALLVKEAVESFNQTTYFDRDSVLGILVQCQHHPQFDLIQKQQCAEWSALLEKPRVRSRKQVAAAKKAVAASTSRKPSAAAAAADNKSDESDYKEGGASESDDEEGDATVKGKKPVAVSDRNRDVKQFPKSSIKKFQQNLLTMGYGRWDTLLEAAGLDWKVSELRCIGESFASICAKESTDQPTRDHFSLYSALSRQDFLEESHKEIANKCLPPQSESTGEGEGAEPPFSVSSFNLLALENSAGSGTSSVSSGGEKSMAQIAASQWIVENFSADPVDPVSCEKMRIGFSKKRVGDVTQSMSLSSDPALDSIVSPLHRVHILAVFYLDKPDNNSSDQPPQTFELPDGNFAKFIRNGSSSGGGHLPIGTIPAETSTEIAVRTYCILSHHSDSTATEKPISFKVPAPGFSGRYCVKYFVPCAANARGKGHHHSAPHLTVDYVCVATSNVFNVQASPALTLNSQFMESAAKTSKSWAQKLQTMHKVKRLISVYGDSLERLVDLPSTLRNRMPSKWWSADDDKSLIIGTYRYGLGRWDAMKTDLSLAFIAHAKEEDDKTGGGGEESLPNSSKLNDRFKRVLQAGMDQIEAAQKKKLKAHKQHEKEKEKEKKEKRASGGSSSTTAATTTTNADEDFMVPKKARDGSLGEEKVEKKKATKQQSISNYTANPDWSKKEKAIFRSALLIHGVCPDRKGEPQWQEFKEKATLKSKTPEMIAAHYQGLMAECERISREDQATSGSKKRSPTPPLPSSTSVSPVPTMSTTPTPPPPPQMEVVDNTDSLMSLPEFVGEEDTPLPPHKASPSPSPVPTAPSPIPPIAVTTTTTTSEVTTPTPVTTIPPSPSKEKDKDHEVAPGTALKLLEHVKLITKLHQNVFTKSDDDIKRYLSDMGAQKQSFRGLPLWWRDTKFDLKMLRAVRDKGLDTEGINEVVCKLREKERSASPIPKKSDKEKEDSNKDEKGVAPKAILSRLSHLAEFFGSHVLSASSATGEKSSSKSKSDGDKKKKKEKEGDDKKKKEGGSKKRERSADGHHGKLTLVKEDGGMAVDSGKLAEEDEPLHLPEKKKQKTGTLDVFLVKKE